MFQFRDAKVQVIYEITKYFANIRVRISRFHYFLVPLHKKYRLCHTATPLTKVEFVFTYVFYF